MTVPCPKGYIFKAETALDPVESNVVSIYNDICSHPDLCEDQSCEYYNDTKEGSLLYHQGLIKAKQIEGVLEDKEKTKAFLKKYGLKEVQEENPIELLHRLAQHHPEVMQKIFDEISENSQS